MFSVGYGKIYFCLFLVADFFVFKASAVYKDMVPNDEERWSAVLNCQQFAYRFTLEALGLQWPNDINVAGDVLPTSIDVGIMLISSTNKITRKS